ncbi:MAG: GNAT family N-acetyltransferase [Halanaerobiales bacterium]|nr:GNAT family N-acetyltransferase [Halanaerobiales bacterium]
MYIDYLKNKKEHLETVNSWLYKQWGHHDLNGSEKEWLVKRRKKLNNNKLMPIIFVALKDETPVGTASIVKNDMETHLELEPWMANVYVRKDKRGKGYGTKLVERILKEAKQCSFSEIYLFTPDKKTFYQRIGWELYGHEDYRNELVDIMKYDLKRVDG